MWDTWVTWKGRGVGEGWRGGRWYGLKTRETQKWRCLQKREWEWSEDGTWEGPLAPVGCSLPIWGGLKGSSVFWDIRFEFEWESERDQEEFEDKRDVVYNSGVLENPGKGVGSGSEGGVDKAMRDQGMSMNQTAWGSVWHGISPEGLLGVTNNWGHCNMCSGTARQTLWLIFLLKEPVFGSCPSEWQCSVPSAGLDWAHTEDHLLLGLSLFTFLSHTGGRKPCVRDGKVCPATHFLNILFISY